MKAGLLPLFIFDPKSQHPNEDNIISVFFKPKCAYICTVTKIVTVMSNGRFSISLHILTLLNQFKNDLVSSEFLAGSININPVLVRKEISNLKSHGLVSSKEGKSGGFSLAKPSSQILLSDVYKAVKQAPILGKAKSKPNPRCEVGRQINRHLEDLFDNAEQALIKNLGKTTLADFTKRFS
jgi:Rrf2 family protein